MNRRSFALTLGVIAALTAACSGTTGSGRVTFNAYAAGPESIAIKGTYAFDNRQGFHVALTRAHLQVGGLFLSRVRPISTVRETACVTPGSYVAQVTNGLLVDLLDPAPQLFPGVGEGVIDHGLTGEVWLTGVRIDEDNDPTVIFDVAGIATKGADAFPFEGALTISQNRIVAPQDAALPGANPLCQQRIVTPIDADVVPADGGSLTVRIDPAGIFQSVDFSQLVPGTGDAPLYRFLDKNEGQPDLNVMNGLRSRDAVYTFSFEGPH